MSGKNTYRDIQASLVRFCRDFGDQHGLDFVNLDASTNAEQWPEADFIGIGELNVELREIDEVTLSFAISTTNDAHLLKMSELINLLVNELLPGAPLMVYDAVTGMIKSALYVTNGVKIGSTIDTKTQPIQPVMVRLLSNPQPG